MTTSFKKFKAKALKNPLVKSEYEALDLSLKVTNR